MVSQTRQRPDTSASGGLWPMNQAPAPHRDIRTQCTVDLGYQINKSHNELSCHAVLPLSLPGGTLAFIQRSQIVDHCIVLLYPISAMADLPSLTSKLSIYPICWNCILTMTSIEVRARNLTSGASRNFTSFYWSRRPVAPVTTGPCCETSVNTLE